MRFLLILIFVVINYLNADEIQRIESIVKDISELRAEYTASQKELLIEKNKNKSLNKEIHSLKLKLKHNKAQTKTKNVLKCVPEKIIVTKVVTKTIVEDNKFPKLQMKSDENIETFKASTFRLKNEALVYDAIAGNEIYNWVAKTSFTSNQQTKKWIKVTGYFTKKVWAKAVEEMWIEKENIIKKDKK